MTETATEIPYFTELLELITVDEEARAAFGEHVHWGYWEDPTNADTSLESFVAASEALSRRTIAEAQLQDGQRVLDVGCGFGGTIGLINQAVSGCELIGVNIEARQLDRARSRVTACNGNDVRFVRMDANELEFEGAFDAIIALECVFHFDRPRFFSHVARLLKPGGRFVLTDFVVNRGRRKLFQLLSLLSRADTIGTYGDIDLSYTKNRYEDLARSVGLELTADSDITANTLPTYEIVLRQIAKVPDPDRSARFRRATEALRKATEWRILGYHLLAFSRKGE